MVVMGMEMGGTLGMEAMKGATSGPPHWIG
jgi:hypothetical protein